VGQREINQRAKVHRARSRSGDRGAAAAAVWVNSLRLQGELCLAGDLMIIELNAGDRITLIRALNRIMVSHWRFAKDCADIGGGLMPGAELTVVEVNKAPGQLWLRAELPGRDPPACLKIAGEEYAPNFKAKKRV
jgi:hypothetical protein